MALPMASSFRSKRRRSRYLPLKSRSSNRTGRHPRGGGPVEVIRRADVCDLPAICAGRSLKCVAARADVVAGTRCRRTCPRHSFEPLPFRHEWHSVRSCLPPDGAPPCAAWLDDLTPPWTFGEGWAHAGEWRYESRELIPRRQQARPGCQCHRAPEADGITTPVWRGNPRTGRINPFHF